MMNRPYVDWSNKWLGKRINYDAYAGYQCVDLIKQYIDECLKMGKVGRLGNAKDLPKNKFFNDWEIIPVGDNLMQGDIIVRTLGTYGHVAIVDRVLKQGEQVRVLEQNGSGKNSGDGLGANAIRFHNYSKSWYQIILRNLKIFKNLEEERAYIENKIRETKEYQNSIRFYKQ